MFDNDEAFCKYNIKNNSNNSWVIVQIGVKQAFYIRFVANQIALFVLTDKIKDYSDNVDNRMNTL